MPLCIDPLTAPGWSFRSVFPFRMIAPQSQTGWKQSGSPPHLAIVVVVVMVVLSFDKGESPVVAVVACSTGFAVCPFAAPFAADGGFVEFVESLG